MDPVRILALSALLVLSACAVRYPRYAGPMPTECTFSPEEATVFVDCSDGTHFEAPARGGMAYGFDGRGRDLQAYVAFQDGRYTIMR